MKTPGFTTTIIVDQTQEEVFNAINNVRGWWNENIEGSTEELNSEFNYHYKDVHHCKIKIVELVPAQKVVWLVTDNYFSFTKDKNEWKDTRIIFEMYKQGSKTRLSFTHEGLTPQYECYEICYEAWTQFIHDSLRSLITTGKGQPSPKDEEEKSFNAQLVEKWSIEA